jgi:aminoglycoside phosphotransferase (APT) family kinase protein
VTGPGSSPVTGRSTDHLLERSGVKGVLISASRDPDAKLTFVVTGSEPASGERLAVKIPATAAAGTAVDREGRMLVEIRRLGLGSLAATVPRYVESLTVDGRPVLVATAVPGTPMAQSYHRFGHTARPASVRRDFEAALSWLTAFQTTTSRAETAPDWPDQVLEAVRGRWDGHRALPAAVERLQQARTSLAGAPVPTTAVHGDFWFGNLLTEAGAVSGVVDWEAAAPHGSPLPDLARFVISYGLYLDRHTGPGRRVLGHAGLSRTGLTPGIAYTLCGSGWFPALARRMLARHIAGLGMPPACWYDVALSGVGEVAASANDDDFGAAHLEQLAALPVRARRHRRDQG